MMLKILMLIFAVFGIESHKCIHDQISKKVKLLHMKKNENEAEETRRLQTDTWRPIKIVGDYSTMTTNSTVTQALIDIIEKDVFARISMTVSVKGSQTISSFSKTGCESFFKTPTKFANLTTTADLLLMVTTVNDNENYLAYASACIDGSDGRPVVGMMAINEKFLSLSPASITKNADTFLHEIHHVLIMSPDLIMAIKSASPPTKNITVVTKSGTFTQIISVKTPKVLQFVQNQFNCQTVDGVPLENGGGSGSANTHWEKLYAGPELMTSMMTGKPILSGLTLSLMEDSGWYKIDFTKAEALIWGNGRGCKFLDFTCSTTFPEFCPAPDPNLSSSFYGCSPDFSAKTYCQVNDFTDSCYINEFKTNLMCSNANSFSATALNEFAGQNSRCFIVVGSTENFPGCYQTNCTNQVISITVASEVKTCSTKDEIVRFAKINIKCPDPVKFCTALGTECLNDCSGAGKCLTSTCWCDFFRTGNDCSQKVSCNKSQSLCSINGLKDGVNGTIYSTTGEWIKSFLVLFLSMMFTMVSVQF